MIEEIHECNVCRGRFSDAELLRTHVCPAAPGNEFISLDEQPEPSDLDRAIAWGEKALAFQGAVPEAKAALATLLNVAKEKRDA